MSEFLAIWLVESEGGESSSRTLLQRRPFVPDVDPPSTYTDEQGRLYVTVHSEHFSVGPDTVHEVTVIAVE